MITELTSFSDSDLQQIDCLMQELSSTSHCTADQLRCVLQSPCSHLYIVREGHQILGCATLCVLYTAEQTIGAIEAVAVRSDCRGQHLGRQLMEHIVSEARQLGVEHLHLTSNPKRVAANALYQSMGFLRKETNCYTMAL